MIQDIVENHAIDIDGVGRVHACGKPGNPLVILLHGFMQTGASWAQIAAQLEGYHVLAPDLLGHGKTPFSREDELSLEAYVEQVNTLVAWARKNTVRFACGLFLGWAHCSALCFSLSRECLCAHIGVGRIGSQKR